MLQKLNITYLIEDARKLSLPDNSVDLVNSNNTFEHIYPDILIPILKEFIRVVKKQGGVMSHFIDMSDHFAHFDRSINIYNFLQFSDKQWKWIDNSIQPQNRNRIYDYKQIYHDLKIPISEEAFRKGNLNELKSIPLADKFINHPLDEIAKSHCHFISNMNSVKSGGHTFN
jgi:ubiquinone/menaquinone biosynthesis C-methylase UbiE